MAGGNAKEFARSLLSAICALTPARSAEIWMLDTATGEFNYCSTVGRGDADGYLKDSPGSRKVPIERNDIKIAIVYFDPLAADLPSRGSQSLSGIFRALGSLHAELSLEKVLHAIRDPVDFRLDRGDFLKEVGRQALKGSGAQKVALREYVNGNLECVGFWPAIEGNLLPISFSATKYQILRMPTWDKPALCATCVSQKRLIWLKPSQLLMFVHL